MAEFYLDTSALLKRYRTEAGTDFVREPFDSRRPNDRIVTSTFTLLEATVLARLAKGRVIRRRSYDSLMSRLYVDAEADLVVANIDDATLSDATRLAIKHALTAGDAIQLATATKLASSLAEDFTMITADDELVTAALSEGLTCLNPNADSSLESLRALR